MKRTIAATTIGVLAGALFVPTLGATAEEGTRPAGDLHAFAVQPDGCTPGYIHINAAEGVTWVVDGQPVAVSAPSSEIQFPGGVQADVYAVPADGYHVDDVKGTQSRPFYLQVNPTDCDTPDNAVDRLRDRIDRQQDRLAARKARIERLRHKVRNLRHRLHH